MQMARGPRTLVAAHARYALSTPPLKATITESYDASSSKRRCSLLVVILFFLVFVEVVFVFLIVSEFVFFLLEILILVLVLVLILVGEIDLVGTDHDQVLATFRTTQGVPLLEV